MPHLRSSLIAATMALALAVACAPAPIAPPQPVALRLPDAAPVASAPPEEPLDRSEVLKEGLALAAKWADGPRYSIEKRDALLAEAQPSEVHLRRMAMTLTRPCLEGSDPEAPACVELARSTKDTPANHDVREALEAIPMLLAEVMGLAEVGPSLRLLLRLDARGIATADDAIERWLERRASATPHRCAPPAKDEVDAARRSIGDLALVVPNPRWPTPAELDDLAYFYAAVENSGPAVGAMKEDTTAAELPPGDPALATRAGLRAEIAAARIDGDPARHLRAATAYLETLGYPGPLRLAEEGDPRWGGAGASYIMRDAARSAEILGRSDVAEALYRRANPGGGMCGSSFGYLRAEQMRGAIRAATEARGCRAVAAELLRGESVDPASPYGPTVLARAGIDVPRLYAAALLLLGRDDAEALGHALGSVPTRAADALARFAREGTEAWARRIDAIPGYADTLGALALPRLLAVAETGAVADRVASINAAGLLAEDHGWDPCLPSTVGWGWGRGSSNGHREVHTVMDDCKTRVPRAMVDATVARIQALAGASDPLVREAVATALGHMGSPKARPVLAKLAKDTFDAGGEVCQLRSDKPEVCRPNRPIAIAAEEALVAITEAEAKRKEQRAHRME